ncbi:hypothetical protein N7468_004696 [Penicillium chermesinum]|uniref:Ribosomal protein S15 n=1 Tax=Penicillium chermesinum TaxID=63820 RepID=A0A9W9P935_9EURO|nr:uncharacterized protein N7468_004696 [Penicillium chermesinum]KAJ5240077.1 hypothetical protein N7468_004696 [Penicillium chermesinum]KAJ6166952.1 hypothetical protein N7470_002399 [Penicillium chermesinum]
MPLRFSIQPSTKALTGAFAGQRPTSASSLTTYAVTRAASSKASTQKRTDFFRIAQARQRKAANLSRQKVLQTEREASLGDPVKSEPTPFIQEIESTQKVSQTRTTENKLNFYLNPSELTSALSFSKDLSEPLQNPDRDTADPQIEKEALEQHERAHKNAQEAIQRIVNLNNGNTKDRMRLNIQKCIEQLGRHHTDSVLPPKPASLQNDMSTGNLEKAVRVGPDTGSPEVQAAILTVKIMNLSRHLQTANKDKHNKRNLQILVHKRQKLLQYLRRKERGGPRWQNLMQTLGLSEASWKGEIAI